MRVSNPNQVKILEQVGLFEIAEYSTSEFIGYVSASYLDSPTEARDEVHRMYERILLHKVSGLRIAYLVEESYFDDTVNYLVIDCFVITNQNQKISVTSIDLEKQIFETATGALPFGKVRNTLQKED